MNFSAMFLVVKLCFSLVNIFLSESVRERLFLRACEVVCMNMCVPCNRESQGRDGAV
jgi:hypothetical protein